MKLLAATLAAVKASHFRGFSYSVTQDTNGDPTKLDIGRSQTWRRSNSGYSGGCIQQDIDNQTPAKEDPEDCWIGTQRCGYTTGGYIVSDIEDSLSTANNHCYGGRIEDFDKPSGPFEFEWDDCCWVKYTTDDNVLVSGGSFGFLAKINDPDNNSPQVKLPPIWKIMAGCPAQTLVLNPSDLDGDKIKCRWGTSNEALGAWKSNHNFASITLDEDTCILTYDGTADQAPDGVKPIAIQIEDFDSNGNVKSSMPLQFLATVWTPQNTNFRTSSRNNNPYQYPDLFPVDDDEDEGRRRRSTTNRTRRSVPDYCSKTPVLQSPTPAAGAVLNSPLSGTTFTLKAGNGIGPISRFTYQSPRGMVCTDVDANGEVQCTFTPTADQKDTVQDFCFQAEDNAGLQTERRCIRISVTDNAPAPLYDIHDMLAAIDSTGNSYQDYGCAGVGNMDADQKNKGKPLDSLDVLLNGRKHCLKCAFDKFSASYEKYSFDKDSQVCGDAANTAKRSFCECDKAFVTTNNAQRYFNGNYANGKGAGSCTAISAGNAADQACCASPTGTFIRYNTNNKCCDAGTIREVGTC